MNNMEPVDLNIFRQLFYYHSRDGFTPRENFLTEAFAHVVASDKAIQQPVVRLLTSNAITGVKSLSVKTQVHQAHDTIENACIPDMIISGRDDEDVEFQIWIENKWDSPVRADQIKNIYLISRRNHVENWMLLSSSHLSPNWRQTRK